MSNAALSADSFETIGSQVSATVVSLPLNPEAQRADPARNAGPETINPYLSEIKRVPLLTAEEERSLGRLIQAGRPAEQRLIVEGILQLTGVSQLGDKEIAALQQQFNARRQAAAHFAAANLRLVVSIASSYYPKSLTLEDRIQEGNLGLLKAVDRFDPERGIKFSTYATYWIRQAISRAVKEKDRLIRQPVSLTESYSRIQESRNRLRSQGQAYDYEAIGVDIKMSPKRVKEITETQSRRITSLQRPIIKGDTDGKTFEDILSDPLADESSPEQNVINLALPAEVEELLTYTQSDLERRIIIKRFGLDGKKPATLEEIKQEVGFTKERIRQIEVKVLANMKRGPAVNTLTQAYEFDEETCRLLMQYFTEQSRGRGGVTKLYKESVDIAVNLLLKACNPVVVGELISQISDDKQLRICLASRFRLTPGKYSLAKLALDHNLYPDTLRKAEAEVLSRLAALASP